WDSNSISSRTMERKRGRGRKREKAEREGFEPSRELAPPTRLAGECLQPLGHLSWDVSAAGPPAVDSRRGRNRGLPSRARAPGGVAEWLNAAALKAVDRFRRSGGSNPSPSAHSAGFPHPQPALNVHS